MSFAQQVRDVIHNQIGDREYTAQDVALHMDLVTDKAKQPMYNILRSFKKYGEIEAVRPGVYRNVRKAEPHRAVIQRRMWSVLRSRRTVTVDDMITLAGAKRGYAKEFLQMLTRQKIVRRIKQHGRRTFKYLMIADPVEMPVDTEKAQRMRALRAARKQAADAIDKAAETMINATAALAGLKTALDDMPEDDDE